MLIYINDNTTLHEMVNQIIFQSLSKALILILKKLLYRKNIDIYYII